MSGSFLAGSFTGLALLDIAAAEPRLAVEGTFGAMAYPPACLDGSICALPNALVSTTTSLISVHSSVFLFCFAMDPLFHYLNRIPNVLAVEAYVDDTTILEMRNLWTGYAKCLSPIKKLALASLLIPIPAIVHFKILL